MSLNKPAGRFGFLFPVLLCLTLLVQPAPAENPLKAIRSGLRKVSSALTPWKKIIPPRAEVVGPATAPKKAKPVKAAPRPTPKTAAAPTKKTPKKAGASAKTTAKTGSESSSASSKKEAKPGLDEASTPDKETGDSSASATPPDPANPDTTDAADGGTASASTPPPPPAELPFGTPVMGRKGYARSPFAEDKGMVDVTDIPAGSKVKCPYTGKIFRVP